MTATPNLGLTLQNTGDNPSTWGAVLNNGVFTPIDSYLGGTYSVSVAGSSNFTPTTANALNFHHVLTGTLTGSISYIFPAVGFFKVIDNQTSGAFTVTVITTAGGSTGVVCPQGQRSMIYSDGTNVNFVDTRSASLTANNTFTGNNTFGGITLTGTCSSSGGTLNGTFAGNHAYSGGVSFTGEAYSPEVALPVATGTMTLDFSTGNNFGGSITGNITLANPTNAQSGQSGAVRFTQGTSGLTIAYGGNWKFQGGAKPPLTGANGAVDILTYYAKDSSTIVGNMVSNIS